MKESKSEICKCRAIVRERSGNKCEICQAAAESMHHRRFRSQQGLWVPSNIMHLCGDGTRGCHGVITNPKGRRGEFEAEGWIVPSWQSWEDTPVRTWWGYLLLDDEGGWTNLGSERPIFNHTDGCEWWHTNECDRGCAA